MKWNRRSRVSWLNVFLPVQILIFGQTLTFAYHSSPSRRLALVSTPITRGNALPSTAREPSKKSTPYNNKRAGVKPNTSSRRPRRSNNHGDMHDAKMLNQKFTACETASEVLQVLQTTNGALTLRAAGGKLNTVNFSTALHRLARHSIPSKERATTLADPRFALLLAGLAEALVTLPFGPRDFSNIGWALAKLKIVPPWSALGVQDTSDEHLLASAATVRTAVWEAAQQRQTRGGDMNLNNSVSWIPSVSTLAGVILDRLTASVPKFAGFRMQEYSNLLWAWATVDRADEAVYGQLVRQMIQAQKTALLQKETDGETLRPQEWSNSLWAFATAQIYNGHEELLAFVAHLCERDDRFIDDFKPQELSNTVWGIASLLSNKKSPLSAREEESALTIIRVAARSFAKRSFEFKTQEISNTLWGLATVGFGLCPSIGQTSNNYVVLTSDELGADAALKDSALDAGVRAAIPNLRRFRSQELNNLAWSLARLADARSPLIKELLQGIALQLSDPSRLVSTQDIGTTMWSLATLDQFDNSLYHRLISKLTEKMIVGSKPQEASMTLWALATAEVDVKELDAFDTTLVPQELRPAPSDAVARLFGAVAEELMRRPQQFKPQEIKDVLWSFSRLGIRHPRLFKVVIEHLVGGQKSRGLNDFEPQSLGNLAWAVARQAQLADDVSDRLKGASISANNHGRLAIYTASYFDIGEDLLQQLFRSIAEADLRANGGLSRLSPQDLANRAWAFAILGLKHADFIEKAKESFVSRVRRFEKGEVNGMTTFKGQEMANFLWALAALNVAADTILEDAAPYFMKLCMRGDTAASPESVARAFKRQELGNIVWACSVFGSFPVDLMNILYMGLVGKGESQHPDIMSATHADIGLQSQAVMSLIYTQASMDLAKIANVLTLPNGFPEAWQQGTQTRKKKGMTDVPFELNLTTSKIQKEVGRALDRIGFKHVEELVITMEQMAKDSAIGFPASPVEVLSIDIANAEKMIAIEVDGPAHYINRIDSRLAKVGESRLVDGKLQYQFAWDGNNQEINGTTALKTRLLSGLGWKLIQIPFWEWYSLEGEEAEDAYCRAALERTGM